jgi:DNA-binding HxlR family transcriptional regulator
VKFIVPDECNHLCLCPIKGIIDVISKKWALFIINVLCNRRKLRFNDLLKELNGISPKTLSDTLKQLQAERIIKRESFAEIPPRVEYSLSQEGIELAAAIVPLLRWAAIREHRSKKCTLPCKGTTAHRIKNQQGRHNAEI